MIVISRFRRKKVWWRVSAWIHLIGLIHQVHTQNTLSNYAVTGAVDGITEGDILTGLQSNPSPQSVQQVVFLSTSDAYVLLDTCPTGSYSTTGSSTCTSCTAGTYSSTTGASSPSACVPCDQGSYSLSIAASSASTCIPCPSNTYFSGTGGGNASVCVSCPVNSNSNPSSKNLGSCVCSPGYYGPNGGPCSPCVEGMWCLVGTSNPCPLNSISSPLASSLAQCLCKPGYFGDTTMSSSNTSSLCQVIRLGGILNLVLKPNFSFFFNAVLQGGPLLPRRGSECKHPMS